MNMTKKRIIYTLSVSLIVVFSTTFAILMTLERMDYRNYLQGEYSKNMYDLITSVQNIRVNLGKAAVTGSREQKIVTFEEIFRYSTTANDKLHSLPIAQETIADTSNFLSQVGDFGNSLVRASSEGKDLTAVDYNNIDRLKDESYKLENELNGVLANINEGKVAWGEIRKKAGGVFAQGGEDVVNEKFKSIEKQVAQYPALIYDGPFSDNIVETKPKVESLPVITVDQAKGVISTIIGKDKVIGIETVQGDTNTKIPSYRFYVTLKGRSANDSKITCEITKNGGKIIYLLDNRNVTASKVDMNEAINDGSRYLDALGYKNMVSSYSLQYDNTVVVNYIYQQDNIIMYPDQIKLKIALDDGSILGIEAEKYLVSHVDRRTIAAPKISQNDAAKKVGSRLSVHGIRLVVIPTETNKEVLCYEFSGNYNNDNYKVYINAETGYEQRILQIINTPNGQLTM